MRGHSGQVRGGRRSSALARAATVAVATIVAVASLAACAPTRPTLSPGSTAQPASEADALAGARAGLDDYLAVGDAVWVTGVDPASIDLVATGEARDDLLSQRDAAAERRAEGWRYEGESSFVEDAPRTTVGPGGDDGGAGELEFGRVEMHGCVRGWLQAFTPSGDPVVYAVTVDALAGDSRDARDSIEAIAPPVVTTVVLVFGGGGVDGGEARWRVESIAPKADAPLVDCDTGAPKGS